MLLINCVALGDLFSLTGSWLFQLQVKMKLIHPCQRVSVRITRGGKAESLVWCQEFLIIVDRQQSESKERAEVKTEAEGARRNTKVPEERSPPDRKRVAPRQSRASRFQQEELVTVPNTAWGPGRAQGPEDSW